jgi:hypothetical protein
MREPCCRCNLVGVVLVLCALHTASAYAQAFSILYHETVERAAFAPSETSGGASKPFVPSLSFEAFGRRFDVALEPNERVMLEPAAQPAGLELYRGELVGESGTWARINRRGSELSGVVFDGVDLYVLEPHHAIARLLAARRSDDGATVVYRWRDTAGAMVDTLHLPSQSGKSSTAMLLEHVAAGAALASPKQLDIGLIADFELSQQFPGVNASEHLLAIANILDGIFGSQTGVFIAVPQLQVFTTSADPFTSADAATLLHELENHKFNTPELRLLGLAHLFTGRDLDDPPGTATPKVGIANLGALCDSRLGAALTQSAFDTGRTALIAAHEIGHNFGAPHDAESGSPCSAALPGFLMESRINGSSTFSQCSLDQMALELSTATCLGELASNDLSVRFGALPTNVVQDSEFTAEVIVDTASVTSARGVQMTLMLGGLYLAEVRGPSGWSCHATRLPAICNADRLPASRSDTITLVLRSIAQVPNLQIEVTAANDPNQANNRLDHLFTPAPTSDLVSSVTPQFIESHLDQEHTVVFHVRNDRFATATGVNARVAFGTNHEVLEIVPSSGSCAQSPTVWIHNCGLGSIPVGEMRTVTVRLRTDSALHGSVGWEQSDLSVSATANELEAMPDNNHARVVIVATEAIVDLMTSITGPTELPLETSGRYAIRYANNGPEAATDVGLAFDGPSSGAALTLEATAGAGSCAVDPNVHWRIICTSAVLGPGQEVVLTAGIRPTAPGHFTLRSSTWARQWDRHAANSSARAELDAPGVTTAPPPTPTPVPPAQPPTQAPPPSGGGGGSSDAALLALLIATLALFRRAERRAPTRAHHYGAPNVP